VNRVIQRRIVANKTNQKERKIGMKRVNCLNPARGSAVWAAAILLAFGLNSATARPPWTPPPKYTVIDLGTVPGLANSMVGEFGRPLNNRGQVVGLSYNVHYTDDLPFLWQKGVLTPLPTPAGANTIAGGQQEPADLFH
jgi:hypothetical protein